MMSMQRMRIPSLILIALLLWTPLASADVQIKSGASTDTLTINTQKAALVADGISTRATYTASSAALVTTATYNISIEASASQGFKLVQWCVGVTSATAAAGVTIAVNRRTTASTGGTVMTNEATGNDSISKMDPADASYGGIARRTSTLGTIGATLDLQGFMIGEIGAGTADAAGMVPFCKQYGRNGEKLPTVVAGVTNGISITVTSLGAGGLAFGSISATIIVE